MKFGYLDDVSGVDFTLPPDDPKTTSLLESLDPVTVPKFFIGCPVWSEKSYVGRIYPPGTKPPNFLREYGKQFNCIEVNATRYGTPQPSTLEKWNDATPDSFYFSFKIPQVISHSKSLVSQESKVRFDGFLSSTIDAFGSKSSLGFIVLPKHFGPHKMSELEAFVDYLPEDYKLAFEFRNQEMNYSDDVYDLLKQNDHVQVITDAPGMREFIHQRLTADRAFIRFVGNKLHPTDFTRIDDWVARLKTWIDGGIKEVYFFMHQPAPFKYLSADIAAHMIRGFKPLYPDADLKPPRNYDDGQTSLGL